MRKLSLIHLVIILCLSVFAFSTHSIASQKDGLLKIYFLNIGQGDAEFIETPSGNQILIDGGPDDKILSELGKVMPFYDHDIDMVIASHPHSDHITGLIDVLGRYQVKNIIEAEESYDSPQFRAWKDAIAKEGAQYTEAMIGQSIDLGDGVTLNILHPFQSVAGTDTRTPHDDMVVTMLEYGSFRVLLAGDMEKKVEDKLMSAGEDLRADILKVGHHGSKTSTSEEFLKIVQPRFAFIEVGKNNVYHLPSPEVLTRLSNHEVKYFRTDQNGTTEVVSDGTSFKIVEHN